MNMDWLVTDDDPDDLGPAHVAAIDPQDMYGAIEALPDHLEEGWETALAALDDVRAAPPEQGHDGVVVCGMGGSAIGADVVGAALPSLTLPYQVVRGYSLPAWVTPQTLVVCVSYSGDTEETLSCLGEALARVCRPVCVATGGRVAAIAAQHGLPLVTVPTGLQPRAALGYLTSAVAAVLTAGAAAPDLSDDVADAAHALRNVLTTVAADLPDRLNRAKSLARRLAGHVPLVYGAGVTVPAARRWKCQLNENAEMPAFWAEVPELDHNEINGWTAAAGLAERVFVVVLDDKGGDERLARRLDLTADAVAPHVGGVAHVDCRGTKPLARVLSALYVGDMVSLYLAVLNGVDPTPVTAIQGFKARLADQADAV